MDNLATIVMSALTALLTIGSDGFIKAMSKDAYEKTKTLLTTLKKRWGEDKIAKEALIDFERTPDTYENLLKDILEKRLAEDKNLAEELKKIIDEMGPVLTVIQNMDVKVTINPFGSNERPQPNDEIGNKPNRINGSIENYGLGVNQKPEEIVSALLKCASMQDRDIRDAILNRMPNDIKDTVQRHPANRVDVNNILTRCMDFQSGISNLLTILKTFEGDSEGMKNLVVLLRR